MLNRGRGVTLLVFAVVAMLGLFSAQAQAQSQNQASCTISGHATATLPWGPGMVPYSLDADLLCEVLLVDTNGFIEDRAFAHFNPSGMFDNLACGNGTIDATMAPLTVTASGFPETKTWLEAQDWRHLIRVAGGVGALTWKAGFSSGGGTVNVTPVPFPEEFPSIGNDCARGFNVTGSFTYTE